MKTWKRLRLRPDLPLSLLLPGILALTGCSRQQAPPAFERPPAPVTVVVAYSQDVPVYIDRPGKCGALEVVSIQPQVSGRITQIHFTDGADLKAGDPLFTIDPRPFQAQLNLAAADFAEKQAVRSLARIEFDREVMLAKTHWNAREDLDTKQNALAVADAQVSASQAALETAGLNLEYCSIRSPIDGRAGKRLVDVGNIVSSIGSGGSPGGTSLLMIQRLDPIYADFDITENDLSAVQQNMAREKLRVQVSLPEDTTATAQQGELTFLDNSVQAGTGLVRLRATIPNKNHQFWPGRFVKVRLILRTIRDAVLVPAAAQQVSATGPFVYVIKPDSTAEMRPITPGQTQADQIVITQGLKAGEQVVVSGQLAVTPGGKVRIDTGTPPSTRGDAGTSATTQRAGASTTTGSTTQTSAPLTK